ncbi:HK97 gp10 family phage protein, partial [Klebsiella pneumoniae]
ALYSALFEIGLESAVLVPIDTSTLVNSQFREVVIKGTRLTGRIGYSANYAAYVHEAKGIHLGKNTPRPVRKGEAPGSRGNIWDTSGEPKFLEKGAENARDRVDAVIRREMEL